MRQDWLTLPEAAKQLGLSPRTVRRWIHEGKLQAELRPGPYGQQYLVPLDHLTAIQASRQVERAERGADLAAVAEVLQSYLDRRETALLAELAELRSAVTRLEAQQVAILEELRALRAERAGE